MNSSDYFDIGCKHKYLHFFQDNSKKLHLLNISNLGQQNLTFEEINLEINFRIPVWHRSVITPEGTIFLTGGSAPAIKLENNSNRVYQYDYDVKTLFEKSPMKYARNSHGICVFQNYIYVVGGCIDEEGYTTECERLEYKYSNTKSSVGWEKIAKLNFAAFAPCLVSYNNRFLFKFGGIMSLNTMNNHIERYDSIGNKWEDIRYDMMYPEEPSLMIGISLMAYAACSQINSNEIYVFGGSEDEPKTNSTYKLRMEGDDFYIEKLGVNLAYNGTFWNNAIVQDNKILCLQNVKLNKSDTFYLGKRKVLCYEKDQWSEIHLANK